MIIYFGCQSKKDIETLSQCGVKDILMSYYRVGKSGTFARMIEGKNLMLDSGAFSAFTKNAKINIYSYMHFIRRFSKHIITYVNLDVIGDPKATLVNQKLMEKEGFHPLPVWHGNEDWQILKDYCSSYDYVGIGGIAGVSEHHSRKRLLDKIFFEFTGKKFHLFGVTSFPILKGYPFYSVDSTSWNASMRYGRHVQDRNVDIRNECTKFGLDYNKFHTDALTKLKFSIMSIKQFENENNCKHITKVNASLNNFGGNRNDNGIQ